MTPLSPDEAYYWVWSRALAPGYLDHPPMVALWIRAGTDLLGPGALGIRLLGPLSAALGSVLLAMAAEDLFPDRRLGGPAAALFNATLLLGVGAITMTPDTPLLFFWTAASWGWARLLRTARPGWWAADRPGGGLRARQQIHRRPAGCRAGRVADRRPGGAPLAAHAMALDGRAGRRALLRPGAGLECRA